MEIDGPLRKEIRLALLDAFPQLNQLRIVVEDALGEPLQNISLANDMPTIVFDLINWAKARGRLTELIIGAAAENAGSAKLRGVADRFKLVDAGQGEIERIVVQGVPFENAGQWLDKLAVLRRAVCRFEPQSPDLSIAGFGTGFLVAPDVMMTNYHVAGSLSDAQAAVARARFDHEIDLAGNEQKGRQVKLAAENWRLAADDKLDYALLRLAERAGDFPLPGGAARECLKLSPHEFLQNEPLVLVQHPMARPLKLSFGTVVQPADGDCVTYTANTEGGSSGSPCMTTALATVAIHHQGLATTNRGVRMGPILNHLKKNGNDRYLAGD